MSKKNNNQLPISFLKAEILSKEYIIELEKKLTDYNKSYRLGKPKISDEEYDILLNELKMLAPKSSFFDQVETEKFVGKKEIRHSTPMLSIEKAYSAKGLTNFIERIQKVATEHGLTNWELRITPKLDGLAGKDEQGIFATRGNGLVGYEISSAFTKGVYPVGGRGLGVGEIVMDNNYFNKHLKEHFKHPRNVVVGIVNSDTVNDYAKKALEERAVCFVPYSQLESYISSVNDFMDSLEMIWDKLILPCIYPTDGMVIEVCGDDSEALKSILGSTNSHNRWQIAYKKKGEVAITTVKGVMWQTGRTGKVTPVLLIEPVNLSGATINRVTAHNAGFFLKLKLDIGAQIEIIRSGEVIPKIEKVLIPAKETNLPTHCCACKTKLIMVNDFLICRRTDCLSQICNKIEHWFKTIGVDWFGGKTVKKIIAAGYNTLPKIYNLTHNDLIVIGFGKVQAENLMTALTLSRTKLLDEATFLAGFGIEGLGKTESKNLLKYFKFENIFNLTKQDILGIHGFGELTSENIVNGLCEHQELIKTMLIFGFVLNHTKNEAKTVNKFTGKKLVFTGKMQRAREDMQIEAGNFGAIIQTAVSSKTDYLIYGENVGLSKLNKAKELDVTVISEQEYRDMF